MLKRKILKGAMSLFLTASIGLSCFSLIASAEVATDTIPGTTKTEKAFDASFLSVTGFAADEVKDRTEYIGTNKYVAVTNELEFIQAIVGASKGEVKVIEVVNDLDFGYEKLSDECKSYGVLHEYASNTSEVITNPGILESGLSQLIISNVNGLTIFSRGGATISRAEWKLQGSCSDIIVRNLNFDSLWHWSESANTKASGWTCMKVNGAKNVWFDHCSFTLGADGNCDSENGTSGLTYTWCTFGMESTPTPDKRSALYQTVSYMEYLYQTNQADANGRYRRFRVSGASVEDILTYEAYHCKAFLIGSGDKDYTDTEGLEDGNQRLEVTFAYCKMNNLGQRIVRMRQGKGHLINCFIDNMGHVEIINKKSVFKGGGWSFYNAIDVHCGGSVAADTCVFNGVNKVIAGSEMNGAFDSNYAWSTYFSNVYNYAMVVNSKMTNTSGQTYTGSSWDNGGNNLFISQDYWADRSTVGKFCWNTTIVGIEDMDRAVPPQPAAPFEFNYDFDYKLPYEYNVLKLDDVETIVDEYSGAYKYCEEPEFWLRTQYSADEDIKLASEKEEIPVTDLILNHETRYISLNDTAQIIVGIVPSYASNRELTYVSGDSNIVSVTDSGLLVAKNYGQTTVTVKAADGVEKSMNVIVYQAVEKISLSKNSVTIYTGSDYTLTATTEPAFSSNEVTWSSSNEAIATVENGVVHPIAPGKVNITVKSVTNPDVTAICRITIKEGETVSTPVPEEKTAYFGDVDRNEKVDASDALLILKHAAKIQDITDELAIVLADVNEDSNINASDALEVLKVAAKLTEVKEYKY